MHACSWVSNIAIINKLLRMLRNSPLDGRIVSILLGLHFRRVNVPASQGEPTTSHGFDCVLF